MDTTTPIATKKTRNFDLIEENLRRGRATLHTLFLALENRDTEMNPATVSEAVDAAISWVDAAYEELNRKEAAAA
ncbi:MAG TPA: hypothetical protein VIN36_11455 [Thiobacillus sp.]